MKALKLSRGLIIFIALIAILAGLSLLGLADTGTSIADSSGSNNQVAINVTGTESPDSASATITTLNSLSVCVFASVAIF